jgi:hypothetical protein
MLRVLLFVVPLALSIYCVVDAISSRDDEVRNLPKIWWILLILFFPVVGSIAWLAAGRPARQPRQPGPRSAFPEYDRPGRFAAADPESDEEFLRRVRERAEEQRRRAREQKEREARAAGGDAGPEPTPKAEPDQPTG